MDNPSPVETTYDKVSDWLPLTLIAAGLAIQWMGSDYGVVICIAGFLIYGMLGFINSIKRKFYRGGLLRLIKLITELTIILLVLGFFAGIETLWYLLMLILLDRLILIPRTALSKI